jgi:hypothetical protein
VESLPLLHDLDRSGELLVPHRLLGLALPPQDNRPLPVHVIRKRPGGSSIIGI